MSLWVFLFLLSNKYQVVVRGIGQKGVKKVSEDTVNIYQSGQ